jgi:YfiH family protein
LCLETRLFYLNFFWNIFLKLSVDVVRINRFDNFPNLIHASSPRYFKNTSDEIEQYDFVGRESFEKKTEHMIQFMETVRIKNNLPFLINQIHSADIFILKNESQTREQVSKVNADAIMTHLSETPIGIFTADCLPVLLYDPKLHVAAAIHAGREGTLQGIVNKSIMAMEREYGCQPQDLVAGLGLGIGGCCYEIDENCLSSFENEIPFESPFVTSKGNGKFLLDLFAVNAQQGMDAGLLPENILRVEECTFCSPMNYFSYRREGTTGRILTFIMLQSRCLLM